MVVDWRQTARSFYSNNKTSNLLNEHFWFKEGVTYSAVTSRGTGFRYLPPECIFDKGGPSIALNDRLTEILALLNSKVAETYFQVFNPSINLQVKDIKALPVILPEDDYVLVRASEMLEIAKMDWDCFETSYGFERHPLCNGECTLDEAFNKWNEEQKYNYDTVLRNETDVNRAFCKLYGMSEISVKFEERDIPVRLADMERDIKSLLSYAVGCMFGRYSLDTEGLAYAGGAWDASKYSSFLPDADNVIPITDEEYLEDDIVSRLCTWLKVVFGESTMEANLDFIAKALGNKGDSSREVIRNYFLNDFFKDHCQTYSVTGSGKRPIYWLFDSGKQNGFKALIYLHRYNADTIGNLRIDYLHRMQRIYESEIGRMQDMIDHSTSGREVAQSTKRREKLQKQLKECREYDERLAHLALSRIELDLDDGVKVNYRKIQTANDGKFYEVLADSKNIMAKK